MGTSISYAHQDFQPGEQHAHHPVTGAAHTDGHSHPPPHPHPHPDHGHLHPVKKTWWERRWMLVVVPVVAVIVGLIVWSRMSEDPADEGKSVSTALVSQMKAAREGWVEGSNPYGGKISSEENNGQHTVTVTGIPNKPCVEASWALAREGQITVNGVFLPRLSAGKLAELCSTGDNKSTIMWMPK